MKLGLGLQRGVKGAPFSLDGLGLTLPIWYDFSTLSAGDGQAVGSVTNLGSAGTSYNLAQTEADAKPTVSETAMGLKCISFDDVDDHLLVNTTYQTTVEHTIAVVLKSDASGWNNTDAAISGDTAGINRFHLLNANALQFRFNAGGTDNGFINVNHNNTDNGTVNYVLNANQVEVLVARKDASHNLHVYNREGDKISYYAADGKTDRGSELGVMGIQLGTPNVNPFGGFIGEFAYFNGAVSEAKAQEIATGLYNKWK